jgi:hypothetical protein
MNDPSNGDRRLSDGIKIAVTAIFYPWGCFKKQQIVFSGPIN